MARIRLAYGQRLRRERSVAQARVQLEFAAGVFRRLQARPWTDRATTELRAAGVTADGPPSAVTRSPPRSGRWQPSPQAG